MTVERTTRPATVIAHVAYFRGQDAFALDRAVTTMAAALGDPDAPLSIWRTGGDESDGAGEARGMGEDAAGGRRSSRAIAEIEERLFAAPLFGGGTLVHVRQPASLMRDAPTRARLLGLVAQVPPGNGLAFTELAAGSKRSQGGEVLREAVEHAGGRVGEFAAPTRDRMERWLEERASELGVRLGPGAVRLLAERIGAFVREGDVDRRRQTQLANAELEKLALLRPDGTVTRGDVAELVPEAVPGSIWGFLDAVGARRTREATQLAERLIAEGMPLPVLISQLHRRLRELIGVRDLLDAGTRPPELTRILKVQPYRAQRLAEQAGTWRGEELEAALFGLVDLDHESKGIGPGGLPLSVSEERSFLSLDVWLAERVSRSG